MDSAQERTIDQWFVERRSKAVTLILAGRVFGGRHGESPQTPRSVTCDDSGFQITFDSTERLSVVHPSGVMLRRDNSLVIHRADRVTFGWHYYGRSQVPENWCEECLQLDGNIIHYERTGPLLPTRQDLTVTGQDMVELSPF